MWILRNVWISFGSLCRHKLRTVMAMSGLVIGVAVTLVMVGVGEGARREVLEQIEMLGSDQLVVYPGKATALPGRELQRPRTVSLRLGDAAAIGAECSGVVRAVPTCSSSRRVKFGRHSVVASVIGTSPAYEDVCNRPLRRGRYFDERECDQGRRMAVIGMTVADRLFGSLDPVGQRIRIGAVPFEVVGVLRRRGVSIDGGGDEDNAILVPIRTAMRRLFRVDHLDGIYVQVCGTDQLPAVERELATLLRQRHDLEWYGRSDDFEIEDQARALRAEMAASDSFTAMVAGTAGISLFVGGIGILAMMLITIRERVAEIGLRMAIGARPRDILVQFLTESMLLATCGGGLGLALGLTIACVVGEYTEWPTHIAPEWGLVATGTSFVLGIAAGVHPAVRAARMDPIRALRAE